MTLFLSDLHLGRGTPAATRAAERDAVAVIRAHEDALAAGGTLVLLGDVFDQYIEYRHLVPKGGPRLVGLLADLADRGVRVLYAVGNRDPWHGDYFEREIGVTVLRRPTRVEIEGAGVYLAHGDRHARRSGRPGGRLPLQPLLRAPLMARLYRMGLPGDAGFGLARWVARKFGSDGAPTATETEALAAEAATVLRRPDVDLVAFGHVHQTALSALAGGAYLNPGYWFGDRTFARLDGGAAELLRWDGAAVPLARLALGAPTLGPPAAGTCALS
ncbi:MAG TPA: UDP-2,3-diacylglucosamine diphosphatase [Rubricoccaceae bacterium]|jgi:UDP-2,3-diacylglucosamine hydrolase